MTILDSHMHVGRVAQFFSDGETEDKLVAAMDRLGVRAGLASVLCRAGDHDPLDDIRRACERFPGRILGQLAPSPHDPLFRRILDRHAGLGCFRGLKLHPCLHGLPFLCADYRYACAVAGERGLPVLFHVWGREDVEGFARLAGEFPSVAMVAGHAGGERDAIRRVMEAAKDQGNIYLDTACSPAWHGQIEAMVAALGDSRILYGSDAVWNSMEAALGRVLYADIPGKSKERILGANLAGILRLDLPAG